jgi:hypothetical protein
MPRNSPCAHPRLTPSRRRRHVRRHDKPAPPRAGACGLALNDWVAGAARVKVFPCELRAQRAKVVQYRVQYFCGCGESRVKSRGNTPSTRVGGSLVGL